MATNLVSVVMQFLTPDMIAKIASALGLDRSVAQKAIGGAVPALLASLADVASRPNGARQLSNTLAQQPTGALESFKNLIGGSSQNTLAETGSSMLSGLFGGASAGHDGTVDWQVRGTRRGNQQVATRHARPCGPRDVGSTAAQRGPGCERARSASRLAKGSDRRGDSVRPGRSAERCRPYRPSGGNNAQRYRGSFGRRKPNCRRLGADSCRGQPGGLRHNKRSIVAVALLVSRPGRIGRSRLVCLGATNRETVAELPRPAATQPGTGTVGVAPSDLTIGGVNLANQVNSSVGTLRSVLPTITDAASAQAAIPKLREATTQLNEVGNLATRLSPEGKSALAKLIAAATPTINQMCDKVLATPGSWRYCETGDR